MIFLRVLILAFCSMCYQLLTARALAELTHQYILSYSWSFGFFLLGMGIGAVVYAKKFIHKKPLNTFYYIETLLAFLGGMSVFLIFCLFIFMNLFVFSERNVYLTKDLLLYALIVITQILIFIIGFLSGFELPIWLKIRDSRLRGAEKQAGWLFSFQKAFKGEGALLGAGYVGGFLGSILLSLFIAPFFGLIKASILVGFINLIVLIESLFTQKKLSIKKGLFLFIPLIILFASANYEKKLMQVHLRTWYLSAELSDLSLKSLKHLFLSLDDQKNILRIRSPYQNIDIIPNHFGHNQYLPHTYLYGKGMAFYLNRQPQFFSKFWKIYHESMVAGGAILADKEPENILILGGGDGLLASQIIKFYKKVKKITLIEIDPTMIKIANHYTPLTLLNKKALKNKKVQVVIADAFIHITKDKNQYDAIFIDFPFPKSFNLSRLYSVEFYTKLKSLLKPDGFIVLDVPIWKSLDNPTLNIKPMPQDILYSTLTYVGYKSILAFGKMEIFLFLTKNKKDLSFKNKKIIYPISQKTKENLISIEDIIIKDIEIKNEYINSVFKPVRFRY